MKGTRPLDNSEIRLVSACFSGNPFEVRNRGLFLLGVSTGGRISELLSLRIDDVSQNGKPVPDLLFDKKASRAPFARHVTDNLSTGVSSSFITRDQFPVIRTGLSIPFCSPLCL